MNDLSILAAQLVTDTQREKPQTSWPFMAQAKGTGPNKQTNGHGHPGFKNCEACAMPRSCQGVRSCAKSPRRPVTARQAEVLDCYVKLGHYKLVARELCVEPMTVANIISRASKTLGAPNTVVLAVMWDRTVRGAA